MDSSSTPDPAAALRAAGLSPASTFGALLIGYAFASIFYGITCCQTLNYYRSQRSKFDSRTIKYMVGIVWFLDTAHQAASTHIVYWYLIINYGQPTSLFTITWSVPTEMVLNFSIALIVQSFYTLRVWRISRNPWISVFCVLLVFTSLGVGIAYPAELIRDPSTISTELKFEKLLTASLVVALATDLFIAVTLAYYLYRSRTGFKRTDTMLMRLVMLSIATGGLTACIWCANMIAFVSAPTALYDYVFNPSISKLYANSLLTMLNYRDFVSDSGKSSGNFDFQSFHLSERSADTRPNIDVFMTKTVETESSKTADLV